MGVAQTEPIDIILPGMSVSTYVTDQSQSSSGKSFPNLHPSSLIYNDVEGRTKQQRRFFPRFWLFFFLRHDITFSVKPKKRKEERGKNNNLSISLFPLSISLYLPPFAFSSYNFCCCLFLLLLSFVSILCHQDKTQNPHTFYTKRRRRRRQNGD